MVKSPATGVFVGSGIISQAAKKAAIPKTSNIDKNKHTFLFMANPFGKVTVTFFKYSNHYIIHIVYCKYCILQHKIK
jgi:hypothetical protein